MKNIKYFFGMAILLFISCTDADDKVQKINLITIENWSLVKVSGSIAGVNNSFPEGMITWKFDEANHTISIVNNNSNEALEDIFNSGVYSYSITDNPTSGICNQKIEINATDFGCFSKTANKITITQSIVDGFDLELIKQ
jgi:hypothetical protein